MGLEMQVFVDAEWCWSTAVMKHVMFWDWKN